jgi:transcription antitermination factor NusG
MNTCNVFEGIDRGAVALSTKQTIGQSRCPQWFCVHTKPSHETQAITSLKTISSSTQENVGVIETYFPQIRTKISVAGHDRNLLRPLFPRYFFVKCDWEKAARFVKSRPQVLSIVQFGAFPSIVSPNVIDELKSFSLTSNEEVLDAISQLKPGQRVLIKSSFFKGMEAEFLSSSNSGQRVALLLNYLQSDTRLILEHPHLQPI